MNKVALITGCAKGIGKSIALELACYGYDIIGTYNTSLKQIKELQRKIENIGVNFTFYKLDICNQDQINKLYNDIKSSNKHIDVLINNAATSKDNEFELKTKDEFMHVLEVNLVGPFLLIQKLYKFMDNGVIINISSTNGINTFTTLDMDYSASKAALINLTKSLALKLENIRVYSLCPNWVNTESIREMNQEYLKDELKRVGQRKLIEPNQVALKIIDIIESDLKSGSTVVMEDNYED